MSDATRAAAAAGAGRTRPRAHAADRRRDLAAIHAAAAQLGLDTTDASVSSAYRLILKAQAGVTSAADADAAGRRRVLAYLRRQARGTQSPPRDGWQAEKMRTLWTRLAAAGVLHDPSEQGLRAFVASLTGVAALRWLDTRQGNRVIEALKAWCARTAAREGES